MRAYTLTTSTKIPALVYGQSVLTGREAIDRAVN